ncbi:hypothetical protein RJT34_02420 [Clitoria ternatea]|uniref:Uncharacterized protein n=1 Tax=Clitoria ternatea TaxID=43366 RepID=A0AAN9KKG4_CLITE
MEERVPEGHVENLTYFEPRRLTFENTSASTKRVVLVVTLDPKDEISRQLKEEITELRHDRSTPTERIVMYDEEQQAQSRTE